jgi:hypothetical protein
MPLYELKDSAELPRLLQANRRVLLKFKLPGCRACERVYEPTKTMAMKYPNVLIIDIDAKQFPDIDTQYGIQQYPSFCKVLVGERSGDIIVGGDLNKIDSIVSKMDSLSTKSRKLSSRPSAKG